MKMLQNEGSQTRHNQTFKDDQYIVTVFGIVNDFLEQLEHKTRGLATVTDAIPSAKCFGNNHKNALGWMQAADFVSKALKHMFFGLEFGILKLAVDGRNNLDNA